MSSNPYFVRKLIKVVRDDPSTVRNVRCILPLPMSEPPVPLVCRMFDIVHKLQSDFRGLLWGFDFIGLVVLYQINLSASKLIEAK
jgi:hypothetical protein